MTDTLHRHRPPLGALIIYGTAGTVLGAISGLVVFVVVLGLVVLGGAAVVAVFHLEGRGGSGSAGSPIFLWIGAGVFSVIGALNGFRREYEHLAD
jgi:hypothetical protein